mmetsp:Transcript_51330/g.167001  ORF Transcript_51330/g.167001 Transcript_51330/m.167001 type:complete len:407 (+) Transcript_51330:282-1502(+)
MGTSSLLAARRRADGPPVAAAISSQPWDCRGPHAGLGLPRRPSVGARGSRATGHRRGCVGCGAHLCAAQPRGVLSARRRLHSLRRRLLPRIHASQPLRLSRRPRGRHLAPPGRTLGLHRAGARLQALVGAPARARQLDLAQPAARKGGGGALSLGRQPDAAALHRGDPHTRRRALRAARILPRHRNCRRRHRRQLRRRRRGRSLRRPHDLCPVRGRLCDLALPAGRGARRARHPASQPADRPADCPADRPASGAARRGGEAGLRLAPAGRGAAWDRAESHRPVGEPRGRPAQRGAAARLDGAGGNASDPAGGRLRPARAALAAARAGPAALGGRGGWAASPRQPVVGRLARGGAPLAGPRRGAPAQAGPRLAQARAARHFPARGGYGEGAVSGRRGGHGGRRRGVG